eukprot:2194292-Rhodomonas_salina.2
MDRGLARADEGWWWCQEDFRDYQPLQALSQPPNVLTAVARTPLCPNIHATSHTLPQHLTPHATSVLRTNACWVQVFRILVLSTVLEKPRVAKADQKRLSESGGLPVDLSYLLFCFERKTTQVPLLNCSTAPLPALRFNLPSASACPAPLSHHRTS